MFNRLTPLLLVLILLACGPEKKDFPQSEPILALQQGVWRATLDIGDVELPFNFFVRNESGLKVDIVNSDEIITIYEFIESNDSLRLTMPLFDSEFIGQVSEDRTKFSGIWKNYARGTEYSIPFQAEAGVSHRFCATNSTIPPMRFPLRYRVDFSPENAADRYPAIGIFETTRNSNRIVGTFTTETGDYRYLEGNFCDGSLLLSCFDGSHAFYFSADYRDGSLINGVFKSGSHWTEPWVGVPDNEYELRDPNSLTTVIDSSAIWNTSFFNEKGEKQRLSELNLDGKVAIVQILGTWCPNCIDESIAYKDLYRKFNSRGLEIIPIAFEATDDPIKAQAILQEFKTDLDIPFPVYYGGKRSKSIASSAIPALDHIMSFPTSILIGRDGNIKKVHTGFYGPGTGIYYDTWLHDTEVLIDSLLNQS